MLQAEIAFTAHVMPAFDRSGDVSFVPTDTQTDDLRYLLVPGWLGSRVE